MDALKPAGGPLIGGQPSLDELKAHAAGGVVGVVNLRRAGEPDQPLSPEEEGREVRALGLAYLHLPIGGGPISRSDVESLGDFLRAQGEATVLVHCKSGGRATGLLLLERAEAFGWPASEVFERGRGLGLVPPPPVVPLLNQFLENRT